MLRKIRDRLSHESEPEEIATDHEDWRDDFKRRKERVESLRRAVAPQPSSLTDALRRFEHRGEGKA